MSNLLSYIIEASLALTAFYAGYYFLLRHKAAADFNRFYLLASLALALGLPFINISPGTAETGTVPIIWEPASQAWNFLPELVVYGKDQPIETAATETAFSWLYWTGFAYLTGMLLCLLMTGFRLLRLKKLISLYPFRYSGDYSYQLASTNGEHPTFSFLHYIFWDNTAPLSSEEERQVLRHEVAHVKNLHSLDLLFLELIKALLWFNPLVYLFRRSLLQVHEFQADQYVLQQSEPEGYLRLMVKQTFRQANIPLVSTFFQHNTLTRIRMIQSKPTHPILRASFSILLAGSIFFVAACEDEASKPETDGQVKQVPLGTENGKATEDLSVSAPPPPPFPESIDIPEENQSIDDTVFEVVEEQPMPVGGMEAFYEFAGKRLVYPEEARANGVEGKVFIQFVVDQQGNVSEVKTVKGVGHGLDQAAEDMIRETKWEPGKQNGQAVKVRMIMPVMFKL